MTREKAFELAMQACKETWNEKTCAEIIKALEQEPTDDATLKDIFCMGCEYKEQEPMTKKVIKMRDATPEERESVANYIKSISKPTGVNFGVLEQEPCGDCISRQAVLNIITEQERLASDRVRDTPSSLGNGLHTWVNPAYTRYSAQLSERSQFKTMIQTMPPATQQQKSGHWKFIQRDKFIDICCSECGYVRVKDYAYNYTIDQLDEQEKKDFLAKSDMNFCECCGAKMQESEDKA